MRQLTLALLGIALATIGMQAQEKTPPASPAFEVASVKPSNPNSSSPLGPVPMVIPAANGRPSLLTALREDLGLKLESERAPVEILVIDSAEMPEAN